ncbi:polar amino acid transport system substrate-binding protein [Duganella sp. CF402]|uniref:substrate-binding periplasmic protein n=1 Tax=unclassified Duganella TaxID=2636909 RepID=UPI0008CF7C73|nr:MULTISPECIES: transporter substrate-binding domain-containing protein [unclassified Duganella]RZT10427.1 amino acid ABC transporter substrate-binding protein (PAAT family) [Duganella sp. BK701]SEL13585.1 polar amino acid transport system substrate-binding protein [Duganella sp. CF402]
MQSTVDRRHALTSLCGIALGALPHFSWAASPELVIAGTRFEKIYERRPDGEFAGMGVDVLREFARRYGYRLQFEIYPWRRAQELVISGRADMLVGPYKSAERERSMRFSEQAFFQDHVAFYVRANAMPVWEGDYHALKARRIATLNGWNYGLAFTQAAPRLHISVTNSVESGLRMLAAGHVEMFATNRRDTDPVLLALGLQDKLMALAPLIDVQDAYFAFPLAPRWAEVPAQLDQMLVEMKKSGELQKRARRYGVTLP